MNPVLLEKDTTTDNCATFSLRSCQLLTLTINNWELGAITQSLQEQVKQAPGFFKQTSLVLDFQFDDPISCDLDKMNMLMLLLQHHELQILACSGPLWVRDLCTFFQIPYLKAPYHHSHTPSQKEQQQAFSLTIPVRPGQQYARQGDLILLAPTHHGSEVLASGHIHAYSRAQGRLLAGINGDTRAQIFCTSLQAELVSIAGVFLTKDLYPKKWLNQSCRISLSPEQSELQFEQLS